MATITLLEKARQRRLNALASLGTGKRTRYEDNIVSIFDYAFDERTDDTTRTATTNVVSFRSRRAEPVAADATTTPDQIAA